MDGNNILQKKKMFLQSKNFLFHYVFYFIFFCQHTPPSFAFVGGGWDGGSALLGVFKTDPNRIKTENRSKKTENRLKPK